MTEIQKKAKNMMDEVGKILSKQQLSNIYLASSIKAIVNTEEGEEDDKAETILQYLQDLQKIMENKEKYEICIELQDFIGYYMQDIEKKRNKRVNNK